MDKRISSFLTFSFLLVLLFSAIIIIFSYIYRYFTLDSYNILLIILIVFSLVTIFVIAFDMLAILHVYKKRNINSFLLIPVRLGLKFVIPFTIFITGMFKYDKDLIRSLFIDINNLFVQSGRCCYNPEQILILLPHCLQDSKCGHKVTNDINNCRQCGKCSIGSILEIAKEKGVRAIVVTGGTAARNLVGKEKPKILLSVACERDLATGISDVRSIPVVGIVNERPNGPCNNTTVNIELLRQKLDSLLYTEKEGLTNGG